MMETLHLNLSAPYFYPTLFLSQSDYAGHHREMSLAFFMKYCKVAYTANLRHFKGAIAKDMSGLKMYKRLADGRHEGLVELPLESADAFKQWYHSGRGGGHPWGVYRGGNTTHIDLGVTEKADGWSVFLRGSSTSRMAETIRIALALVTEGLPVEIHDAEELRSRLFGMDNMGIIPKFIMNHRASQNFEKGDRVYDCSHLHEFSRKNRILPFIRWKMIDPLRPKIV